MKILNPIQLILKERLIAIIRVNDNTLMEQIVTSLSNGGIRVIEITLNTPKAFESIRKVNRLFPHLLIGAGTVLTEEMAKEAIQAGAKFILAPTLSKSTIQAGLKENIPVIPGVMTPTEAYTAHKYGAEIIKFFPTGSLGSSFAKDIAGPLPFIKLMGVGGITLSNTEVYLTSGWHSLGIGSQLVNNELVKKRDFEEIEKRARKFIEIRDMVGQIGR